MRAFFFFLSVSFVFLFTHSIHAHIIHVPGDFSSIQEAINHAAEGDTVMVAPGVYNEHDIDFLGKGIVVMGTAPEDTVVVASTIIDGNLFGSVFLFHSGEDLSSVLMGLTITGGLAVAGGGVYCHSSSPVISHCVIEGNESNGGRPYGGGGIYCEIASPIIVNCRIRNNDAQRGSGMGCYDFASPKIAACVFSGNSSSNGSGGGIHCNLSSDPIILISWFICNSAEAGGGIFCSESSPQVINCIIVGNSAIYDGGGIKSRLYESEPLVMNCTITENTASRCGGGFACMVSSRPLIQNSIVWGNELEDIGIMYSGDPTVIYSDIGGGWTGTGNIDADPLFTTYDDFEFFLDSGSPCIDAGDPAIEDGISDWKPAWPDWHTDGPRSDMGAYGGPLNIEWLFH
jgi:parallel beta-helix repeat protein